MSHVNIKVTGDNEAPSAKQKAELIHGVTGLLSHVLNKSPEITVVVVDGIDMNSWSIDSRSVTVRHAEARNKQALTI